MIIEIKTAKNGFVIEVRESGYAEGISYVAENEKSLINVISTVWRKYKNKQAKGDDKNG